MKFSVVYRPSVPASTSPYRLLDEQGQKSPGPMPSSMPSAFANFRCVRCAPTLMTCCTSPVGGRNASRCREITESTLLDYVRHQLDQKPQPTPQTVNHRLGVLRCLYRFHYGQEIPAGQSHFQRFYTDPIPARLRPGCAAPLTRGLRLRQPRRVIVPLSAEEVAKFWRSFRTFRDLALVGLMLLDGLRSCEVWLSNSRIFNSPTPRCAFSAKATRNASCRCRRNHRGARKVSATGTTAHQFPFPVRFPERPPARSAHDPAGLRSLFRHHRLRSHVPQANPHRFRHTFGADMVRAGISLPALQHLMGHSQIHTTMLYVQLAPQDVWREYARAIENRTRLSPPPIP